MVQRPFWVKKISEAWKKRPVVWLSGVRRVGKTTLSKMFSDALYLNCDLPSVGMKLEDPELFYNERANGSQVIFDEIHKLQDPSRVLKIAADEYAHLKILATGSSTLSATKKFRDSLTGRKESVYLPPVLWEECINEFKINNIERRLLHGGLPEQLLSTRKDEPFFAEWMDSFYARDVEELFSIRDRGGFIRLLHLIARNSGGLLDYTHYAKLSQLSRPTVKTYIDAMEIVNVIYLLPPFYGGGRQEITRRPKIYAFDTGFVTFVKGWKNIREEDIGLLWEHLVLDTLRTAFLKRQLFYWRDKTGREIDFVVNLGRERVDAIECKNNYNKFNADSLSVFRSLYPTGTNYVFSPKIKSPFKRKIQGFVINFCSIFDLRKVLSL